MTCNTINHFWSKGTCPLIRIIQYIVLFIVLYSEGDLGNLFCPDRQASFWLCIQKVMTFFIADKTPPKSNICYWGCVLFCRKYAYCSKSCWLKTFPCWLIHIQNGYYEKFYTRQCLKNKPCQTLGVPFPSNRNLRETYLDFEIVSHFLCTNWLAWCDLFFQISFNHALFIY